MRFAIVENGVVANVAVADVALADNWIASDAANPGDSYSGGQFVPAAESAERAWLVRSMRNQKLAECDWTQVADSTADKAAWATYRQALRDITDQPGFPWDIAWPTPPA